MRCIIGRSLEAVGALINQRETELVDRFCAELEDVCKGRQLSSFYTFTHIRVVRATSVKVCGRVHDSGGDRSAANVEVLMPYLLKQAIPLTKAYQGRSKKAHG